MTKRNHPGGYARAAPTGTARANLVPRKHFGGLWAPRRPG